ncbi:DNA repair protein RecO [Candidatus Peregrinibacteria bacterium]|nr:DNA repair protein RecO [Candidatus Peregrinibacteria bacterium]
MPRTLTLDTIVLKVHDVGEADRFCIVFTKERGKMAIRARGVRKPGSRLGGTLLPLRRITMHVKASSTGYIVTDASIAGEILGNDVRAFLHAQQGIELLLLSLHDEEPLPELFDATAGFLERCFRGADHTVLPYTLRMLHLLGLLPDTGNIRFSRCSPNQMIYIQKSMEGNWESLPALLQKEKEFFSPVCAELLSEALSRAPRAGVIAQAMR